MKAVRDVVAAPRRADYGWVLSGSVNVNRFPKGSVTDMS